MAALGKGQRALRSPRSEPKRIPPYITPTRTPIRSKQITPLSRILAPPLRRNTNFYESGRRQSLFYTQVYCHAHSPSQAQGQVQAVTTFAFIVAFASTQKSSSYYPSLAYMTAAGGRTMHRRAVDRPGSCATNEDTAATGSSSSNHGCDGMNMAPQWLLMFLRAVQQSGTCSLSC